MNKKIVNFAKNISMTIEELQEYYYSGRELPKTIELMPGVKVTDVPKFVDSHFTVLMANPYSKASYPSFKRAIGS